MSMPINYRQLNERIADFIRQGIVNPNIGIAQKPTPAQIVSVNKHALKHGVSRDEAQGFIDNALVMFNQGSRFLYVSKEGNAVLVDKYNRLISAYRKENFDPGIVAIIEVIRNG